MKSGRMKLRPASTGFRPALPGHPAALTGSMAMTMSRLRQEDRHREKRWDKLKNRRQPARQNQRSLTVLQSFSPELGAVLFLADLLLLGLLLYYLHFGHFSNVLSW